MRLHLAILITPIAALTTAHGLAFAQEDEREKAFRAEQVAVFRPADHLLPMEGHMRDLRGMGYQILLYEKLCPEKDDASPRVIVIPSFSAEWCLSISRSAPEVTLRMADEHLWNSKQPEKVAISTRKLVVDETTASALRRVWNAMLLCTRYPRYGSSGFDGERYYFSAVKIMESSLESPTFLAVSAWSPELDTKPGRLVWIVEQLRQLVAGAKSARSSEASIREAAQRLLADIAKEQSTAETKPGDNKPAAPDRNPR